MSWHECEECGQACYCDQDDCFHDRQPRGCDHLRYGSDVCEVADDVELYEPPAPAETKKETP